MQQDWHLRRLGSKRFHNYKRISAASRRECNLCSHKLIHLSHGIISVSSAISQSARTRDSFLQLGNFTSLLRTPECISLFLSFAFIRALNSFGAAKRKLLRGESKFADPLMMRTMPPRHLRAFQINLSLICTHLTYTQRG